VADEPFSGAEELFCVARINCFWDFLEGGPAGWNRYGRVSRFRSYNGLVRRFRYRVGQRAGQRENVARSNRTLGSAIWAYSGRFSGWISSQTALLYREDQPAFRISWVVTVLVTVNGNSRGAGDRHLVFVQGHQDWIFRVVVCTVARPGYGVLEGVASVICIGIHAVFIPGESLRLLGVSRIFLTRLCTLPYQVMSG